MTDDKRTHQERLKGILHSERPAPLSTTKDGEGEGGEDSCAAFGYLRGIRDQAALGKLPAEERAALAQLWSDVAALLKKADAPPTKELRP